MGPLEEQGERTIWRKASRGPSQKLWPSSVDSALLRGLGKEGGGEGIGLKPSQKPGRQKGTQQTAGVQSRVKAFGEKNLQEQRMEDAQDREFMGRASKPRGETAVRILQRCQHHIRIGEIEGKSTQKAIITVGRHWGPDCGFW